MRVAFDIPADAKALTKLEGGISRDLIAGLREQGLIAAGPRSPTLGAPYAYVTTTEKFLLEFGFESLRDLPHLEALMDAGLVSAEVADGAPDRAGSDGDDLHPPEVSHDRVA
jgi:chromosome segregation and condensation protein ScpB